MSPEQIALENSWLILIGTLGGAFVGMLGGVVGAWLTMRAESRRHIHRLACDVALKEWEHTREVAGFVLSPFHHLYFHTRAVEAALAGRLTPELWRKIREDTDALIAVSKELTPPDGSQRSSPKRC
jgi:hypothetical protein